MTEDFWFLISLAALCFAVLAGFALLGAVLL